MEQSEILIQKQLYGSSNNIWKRSRPALLEHPKSFFSKEPSKVFQRNVPQFVKKNKFIPQKIIVNLINYDS